MMDNLKYLSIIDKIELIDKNRSLLIFFNGPNIDGIMPEARMRQNEIF